MNAPMNVLLPDALVMAAIIVAWLNDTLPVPPAAA